ncbi:amidohydrolase family protein [Sphingobium sp. BS19]|uniref:amidohydrolase family protein n=1 Tax=Sphingobium sp. BS19 TaxID=3018973 RepID=UPI0022EFB650|nr:amidohydrolase family protein [Sphingobium sp. BS19]GLJ00506.1 2-hydroxy-3-carboxy-6-oxo-7-methylocta-2,4-dienoa te decarboxylase [Sphingobium sp. BS19]
MTETIDIHTHMVPANFPAYTGASTSVPWPSMCHDGCGHANMMVSGKVFRNVRDAAWSSERRIADMAQMGLARQVVSPMPELLSYWLEPADAQALLRHVNGEISAMVAQDPAHFIGMGAVPLQDIDLAISELRYNREILGLRAVEVGSNINGAAIGDKRFEPFFEAAVDLDVSVFVHAIRASGREMLAGPAFLEPIIAFPGEIGLAAASLITGGVLSRHPDLRIAFSHGGGALMTILARMEHYWRVLPAFADLLEESPLSTARRAYYDLTVFNPALVGQLAKTFGVGQLLIGSDYPFRGHEEAPIKLLEQASLEQNGPSAEEIRQISVLNPRRYLGLLPCYEIKE